MKMIIGDFVSYSSKTYFRILIKLVVHVNSVVSTVCHFLVSYPSYINFIKVRPI